MTIEQHVEIRGFRLSLTFQTKEQVSHKLLTENDTLVNLVKEAIFNAGTEIIKLLQHEAGYRKSQGSLPALPE